MSLPASPPKFSSWSAMVTSIRHGEDGWRAYALQKGIGATPDGAFGPKTLTALKNFQAAEGLVADGIAGPVTQGKILEVAEAGSLKRYHTLQKGVLKGFAEAEGAGLLAATNWGVPGGVDCGPVQIRVDGPPFDKDALMRAFGPRESFDYAAHRLVATRNNFMSRNNSLTLRRATELAVLSHNWPAGADQIVRYGHLLSPNRIATWAPKPDGGFYTYQEWAEVYPERVLKYVIW